MPNNEIQDQLLRRLFGLSGQVAVVTGAMGRLGREYVRTLADAGARVAAIDIAGSPATFSFLSGGGLPIHTELVDLTKKADVDAAFARLSATLGAATILVNNAGMGSSPASAALETGPFEDYPEEAWDTMIDSHLKSTLFASQAFVRHFRAAGHAAGSYEFKRTTGATFFKPVGYSVAKSGVLNFTRWLAEYGAPLGIRANTLVPGGVREAEHHPDFVREYERRTPLGRMASEDDYNGAVLFLASPASAYMTGATVVVDGGWTAR